MVIGVLSLFGMSHFAFADVSFIGSSVSDIQVSLTDGGSNPYTYWAFSTSTDLATGQCTGGNPTTSFYGLFLIFGVGSTDTCFPSLGLPANQSLPSGIYYVLESHVFPYVWSKYGTLVVSGDSYNGSDFSTRFISVTPANGALISTTTQFQCGGFDFQAIYCDSATTTLSWNVYVSSSDYVASSTFLRFTLTSGVGVSNLEGVRAGYGGLIDIPILSSGFSTVSTTSNMLAMGAVREDSSIILPVTDSAWYCVFGFCSTSTAIVATSTLFTVGTSTEADRILAETLGTTQGLVNQVASSTASVSGYCNPFGGKFDIVSCLYASVQYLVVPPSDKLNVALSVFYDNTLHIFPFGYITRFVQILAMTGSVEPPALSYTFGSSSPSVLAGTNVTFQIYDSQNMGTTSPLYLAKTDDGTNKNIWDIVDPPITTLTAIMVLYVILNDLLGLEIGHLRRQTDTMEDKQNMYQRSITNNINQGQSSRRGRKFK